MSKLINDLTSNTDNNEKKLRENRKSTNVSKINNLLSTDVDNTNSIDNSYDSFATIKSNSDLSSSEYVLLPNTNDDESNITYFSSSDLYNSDTTTSKNEVMYSTKKDMMKLCGATYEQSNLAINIAKDEVMNNNLYNNNSYSNRNDILKSTAVRLESDINFINTNVNKRCMLELLGNIIVEIEDDNNAKNTLGGKGNNNNIKDDNLLESTMSQKNSNVQRLDEDHKDEINKKFYKKRKAGGIQECFFIIIFLLIIIYI